MNAEELNYTPAVRLAEMIRRKEVSAVEVTETVLDRLETLNPKLNAVCTLTAEQALDQARAADQALADGAALGPLHGVPVTIKDLHMTKGVRTMGGSHIFADRVPDYDAPFVPRLRAAGTILIGKTTVPEFGWKGCGDSPLTGISHNPWKKGFNAGGSSTGAAICAAAGIGPLHQGSDGAGSIRMPAAFCGIYGFKPTFGRVPTHPVGNMDYVSHVGPMTRTVADAALMLSAMAGPDPMDKTSLDAPPQDYLATLQSGIKGLRVAFSSNLGYLPVDTEVATVVAEAAKTFEALGCVVEEAHPGWDDPMEIEEFLWRTQFAGNQGGFLPEWEDRMDPGLVACIKEGNHQSAAEYVRIMGRKLALYDQARAFFDNYDLLLTPSLSVAAFPAGRLYPEHYEEHPWNWIRWAGFSYPFNFTGQPAATCPAGFTPAGLPVGLQIVAPRLEDGRVLRASAAFEAARPWATSRPDLSDEAWA